MPSTITVNIEGGRINTSLQVGDSVYYCGVVDEQAGKNHPGTGGVDTHPRKLEGVVTFIDRNDGKIKITSPLPAGSVPELAAMYMFFAKDRRANFSGIKGYYTEVEFKNWSRFPVEMFAASVDYDESSK